MDQKPEPEFLDVVHQGKVVGKVPNSGSNMETIAAAHSLFGKLGILPETSTPLQTMFRQAISFAQVANDCHLKIQESRGHIRYVAPFVVNAAFAIEVYLKTLSTACGNGQGKTHDLLRLYERLPNKAKKLLEDAGPAAAEGSGLDPLPDVMATLTELRSAFVDWRYLYESTGPKEVKIQHMIYVAKALHGACKATGAV